MKHKTHRAAANRLPTVPRGTEWLRITPTPYRDDALIGALTDAIADVTKPAPRRSHAPAVNDCHNRQPAREIPSELGSRQGGRQPLRRSSGW